MLNRSALLALLAICAGCAAPATTLDRPYAEPEYRVAPPDVLLIAVRPAPEIERELVVRPDGKISFDLIGDVHVQGHTVTEIREEMERRLKEFVVHPDVSVTLAASQSRRVHVLGEVRSPGSYPIIGEMRAVDAIAEAGGPTRLASNGVRLARPGEQGGVYAVDFHAITRNAIADTNYVLYPGDVVYVPPSVPARIGYALQVVFYPIQAIVGLGGPLIRY